VSRRSEVADRGRRDTGERTGERELVAFYGGDKPSMRIEPAARRRAWMDETAGHWANRCLPLLVANESGWVLLNPLGFTATWDGGTSIESVTVAFDDAAGAQAPAVRSHFGYGTLTWGVPYLFRTSPGVNLLVRGPANSPRDGIYALEGLVETDWSVATFTMNWKFTRAHLPVRFERDEPFCMVVPQARGNLESFRPIVRPLPADSETGKAARRWAEARDAMQRRKFLGRYSGMSADAADAWEADYYRGLQPDGEPAPDHQTRIRLGQFRHDP